jgi:hypothetical protein
MYADKRAAMTGRCSERLEEQRPCTMHCGDDRDDQMKNKNKQIMMS